MARFDKDFGGNGEEPLPLNELLMLLGEAQADPSSRDDAIACYLSGSDGWREAVKELGGAFARPGARLREDKAE